MVSACKIAKGKSGIPSNESLVCTDIHLPVWSPSVGDCEMDNVSSTAVQTFFSFARLLPGQPPRRQAEGKRSVEFPLTKMRGDQQRLE